MKVLKIIGPIGHILGLIPLVKVFTMQDLVESLTDAGCAIDHRWQPGKGKAVLMVAKTAEQPRSPPWPGSGSLPCGLPCPIRPGERLEVRDS